MDCRWELHSDKRLLWADNDCVGELIINHSRDIQYNNIRITEVKQGIFEITADFSVSDTQRPLSLTIDFLASYIAKWCVIPAISYNGNNWGKGLEPKGFETEGGHWSFSGSRTAAPGATYSEGEKWAVGFFAGKNDTLPDCSCSLIPTQDRVIHRLIWPEQEYPKSYYQRDRYRDSFEEKMDLNDASRFSLIVYLVVRSVKQDKLSYGGMLDFAWELNYHKQKSWFTPEEIWGLGYCYAKNSLYVKDRIFKGFSKGLTWDGHSWRLRPSAKYLAGWTGQNLSLANSMLSNFITTGNRSDLDMALNTFDTWSNYARVDNGLIRCLFDYVLGDVNNVEEAQDACNLSEAALNFFEAWQQLKTCGIDRSIYKSIGLGICDFVLRRQSPDGRFGRSWSNDGRCIDPNGTIGAYFIIPFIKAYEITGDKKYIKSAKMGFEYYINEFLSNGYTSAAALDTYCIDKESAIPLLKSSMLLYEKEKIEKYLNYAELVSYYLATWQWHYSQVFPKGTPLSDMNYDTFGATSVSVQHHHLDSFAVLFVPEWLKLADLSSNDIWRQRAVSAWKNGTFGISDGNLEVRGVKRPRGSQDEGFYHTHWGEPNQKSESPMGNVSNWLVAWPAAFRLQTLRRLKCNEISWNTLEE